MPDDRDWSESDYTRLYHSILSDPKFATVYPDDRAWALYTRLLMAADAAWPTSPSLPRSAGKYAVRVLVEAGVIVLAGDLVTIPALAKERAHRYGKGKGRVRYRSDDPNAPSGRDRFHDPSAPTDGAARTKWWRTRTAVFERDSYTCRYCGSTEIERRMLIAEHVVPITWDEGRDDSPENLVTACRSCNARKGTRTPDEAGMRLLSVDEVTLLASQRDAQLVTATLSQDVSPEPRGRAGTSPSSLHSPSDSESDDRASDPEWPVLRYLASVGAHVDPNGNGIHRKVVDLVRRRGAPAVMAALEESHRNDPKASGRQLVFGAENSLDRPLAKASGSSTGGHTRSAQEVEDAFNR